MTLAEKIRNKLWTYKQPLTLEPKTAGQAVSDLFFWRNSPRWNTCFELLDIPKLIDQNSGESPPVKFIFLDTQGGLLKEDQVSFDGYLRKQIDLKDLVSDLDMEYGTFCVFHQNVPSQIKEAGSFLAERGYVSYRLDNSSVRSYVHGNLDAVTLQNDKVYFLEGNSFMKRAYYPQYPLEPNCTYEIVIVNPSQKRQKIQCDLLSIHNTLIESQERLLEVGGSNIFVFNISGQNHCKLTIKSHLIMARPIIFKINTFGIDVFHG